MPGGHQLVPGRQLMRSFCTLFDSNYLVRGLTLYHSLQSHCPEFQLWILCLDDACHEFFERESLPGIRAIPLQQLLAADPGLEEARGNRSLIEFYFTCSSSLTWYVMQQDAEQELVTYLDADLYFYSDPTPIYEELEDHSIGIIPHRFPPNMRKLERYGLYNVAWVSFRRDEQGLACLDQWRRQCQDWCYDRLEGDRFADQKYLDAWPETFSRTRIIANKGANLAPWNVSGFRVTRREGTLYVDDDALVFYHFHGLKRIGGLPLFDTSLGENRATLTHTLRYHVYRPYLQAQSDTGRRWLGNDGVNVKTTGVRDFVNQFWRFRLAHSLSRILVTLYSLFICRAFMRFRPGDSKP